MINKPQISVVCSKYLLFSFIVLRVGWLSFTCSDLGPFQAAGLCLGLLCMSHLGSLAHACRLVMAETQSRGKTTKCLLRPRLGIGILPHCSHSIGYSKTQGQIQHPWTRGHTQHLCQWVELQMPLEKALGA